MFRLGHEGDVARLTLDRPEARNAIPASGWDELADRLAELERSEARLLVVSGSGGSFCAGADLSDFESFQRDEAARVGFRYKIRAALDRLGNLEIPTIALIDGPCYGAGVALAIACDLRIATVHARFAITPAKIGLSYPQEDVHRLVQLVGPGHAALLLFSAGSIDGEEAARIGLVELYEPEGGLEPIVSAMLDNSGASLTALKRGIRLGAAGRREDEEQDRLFDGLIGGGEAARRLDALRRK